jgi:hypothetical protein
VRLGDQDGRRRAARSLGRDRTSAKESLGAAVGAEEAMPETFAQLDELLISLR